MKSKSIIKEKRPWACIQVVYKRKQGKLQLSLTL